MIEKTRKTEITPIDGTPEKRLFLSIVSDYGLRTGVFELIDNALDIWNARGRGIPLKVEIVLDSKRQIISVVDNAGGVKEADLRDLVAPGASGNSIGEESIGIFGVGGKRAGIALGETVTIQTCHKDDKSLQLDITNEWLETEDWQLPAYEVPNLEVGKTSIEVTKLRQQLSEGAVNAIHQEIGETYAWYIDNGCSIELNGTAVDGISLENWAYPPLFRPKKIVSTVDLANGNSLDVEIISGLIRDRDPESENYGVCFFCNNRLITKHLKTREVGYFVTAEAGVPHPDASMARTIVKITGPANLMPWNSSKSGINYSHAAFTGVRPNTIKLHSYFSKLSRRLKNNWADAVQKHQSGTIEKLKTGQVLSTAPVTLPKLPSLRPRSRSVVLLEMNERVLSSKPWTRGLIESLGLVELIAKQKLGSKNRAALILLDSNFEIALKEFIVNRKDLYPVSSYSDSQIAQLFKNRRSVINEVVKHKAISKTMLSKIDHYYAMRNKLIHERATVGIPDEAIVDYQNVIEAVLKKLFGLKFPKD